jgi:hypothetical protein
MTSPSLAEQAIAGREFTTVQMPKDFQVYCFKCNATIRSGDLAKRYDGATYVHETCPSTPHKTFAPHKY